MQEKSYFTQTIGLEWGPTGLKAAQVSLLKGKPHVDKFYFFPFEDTPKHAGHAAANPLRMTDEGKAFLDNADHSLIVSVMNASETLVRQLEIQLKKEKDIDAVLAFQAEPILPYPIENAVIDRIKLADTKDGTNLSFFSARKDHVQQHLDRWKLLEIEPEVVSSVPLALAAFSRIAVNGESPYLVLHLAMGGTCCAYVNHGKLLAAQASTLGLHALKQALEKDRGFEDMVALDRAFTSMDWGHISANEFPALTAAMENFRKELSRIVFSLSKQTDNLQVPDILLTGDGAEFPILSQVLTQELGKHIMVPNPIFTQPMTSEQLQSYAIPIGAALTALPKYPNQINFRRQEFSYPYPWKRLIKSFALYGVLCALLAASLYIFGEAYLRSKEDEIRRDYSEVLTILNKPFNEFEREIGKGSAGRITPSPQPSIESLSPDDIRSRIQIIDKEMRSVPDIFPLSPNVPLVSDVLAWISTHPKALAKNPETNQLSPLITIENFSYTMAKRPEMTKKQEKYQVKVELEFSTPNPTIAREFHDALIAPNDFIDPKGDVKWSTNKGKYKAIFFLKDKTSYSTGGS